MDDRNPDALHMLDRRRLMGLAGIASLSATSLFEPLMAPARANPVSPGMAPQVADLPWPPTGSFASKAIVGPHQARAATMVEHTPLLGLPYYSAFIYGNLRDDQGNLSEWVRLFKVEPSGARQGLFVQSSAGKDTLRAMPDLFMAAATDYAASIHDGTGVWQSPKDAKGKPFRLTMASDGATITWMEGDTLALTGTLMGPGLQWHIPDPQGSSLYVSQIYEVKGIALGKPVHGIMAFDKIHLPKGVEQYSDGDPLFRKQDHHRTWYTWATRYKDGSYDAGHLVLGTDRMGFALLTNERAELTLDTDVTGSVSLTPDAPWPRQIKVRTSKGVEWEFLPDLKGTMPDMLGGTKDTAAYTPQTEGRWRRVGDRREPAVWFAWGEVAPKGRTNYSRRFAF